MHGKNNRIGFDKEYGLAKIERMMIMRLTSIEHKRCYSELKKTIVLVGPIVAALLSQKGMQVVNSLVLGTLGPEALATGALVDPLYTFFWAMGIGILSAVGVLTARAYSEKKDSQAATIFYSSMYINVLFSAIAIFILWIVPSHLVLLGQDPIVVKNTVEYMHALVWGMPALLGYFAMLEFTSSLNYPKVAMWVSLIGIPFVAALNYVFAYGKFGLPELGIVGIGLSTSLVQWGMFIGFFVYIVRHKKLGKYLLVSGNKGFSRPVASEIFRIGFPAGIIYLLEMALVFSVAIMMGSFGTATLAAHQILMTSTTVLCRFPMALSITSAIRTSQNIGMKKYNRVKPALYANLSLGVFLGTLFGLIFIASPETLVSLFLNSSEVDYSDVLHVVKNLLYIAAITQLVDYLVSIMNGCLRGLKDTFVPMQICLSSYWIAGIGGAYVLAYIVHLEGVGVWLGQVSGFLVASGFLYIRFIRIYKKSIQEASACTTYAVDLGAKEQKGC